MLRSHAELCRLQKHEIRGEQNGICSSPKIRSFGRTTIAWSHRAGQLASVWPAEAHWRPRLSSTAHMEGWKAGSVPMSFNQLHINQAKQVRRCWLSFVLRKGIKHGHTEGKLTISSNIYTNVSLDVFVCFCLF